MSYAFSQRTPPWPEGAERTPRGDAGAISLVVLFLLVVFSGLGLGMITLSQVHIKVNAWRKFSLFLDCASENGLKRGLRDLGDWLQSNGPAMPISSNLFEDFRGSPGAVFPLLLEEALGAGFPRLLRETSDGLNWETLSTCGLQSVEDRGEHFRIQAGLRIESSGGMDRLRPKRVSSLQGSLGILAGRLPLPAIPLLINKEMTESENGRFLKDNGISLMSGEGNLLSPRLAASGKDIIPGDATALAARALDIRIFTPQDLSAAKLRAALGLEPTEDPVPDGVYLIKTDLGLGGIFVQGDAEEMVLAIDGDSQIIVFRLEAGEWSLAFSPSRSRTEFRTPDGISSYEFAPLGIIIVNGAIRSLGGGVAGADGTVVMVKDREVPSVLNGVGLTIVSSDRITLSSHLVLQGVRWQDGIPYLKESQSQLVIFSTGRDLLSQAELEGGIAVSEGAPDDLKLHASLTAAGADFKIEGSGKTVEILGALHAAGYAGNGNALRLAADERFASGELGGNGPVAATPLFSVYSLKVIGWKEHE
jgi:hypothetical protein